MLPPITVSRGIFGSTNIGVQSLVMYESWFRQASAAGAKVNVRENTLARR